jgi:hypothetical protein
MKKFLIFTAICLGFSYQSYAEINDDGQRSLMMLRFRPTNTDTDEAWNETYKMIKENPGCCDEVWFSTGMGFLPEKWHLDKLKRMERAMAQLRELGVGSSLQFQMTIGHGDKFGVGNEHLYAEKTWRGWTGSQGVEAKYCSCPRNPKFMDYIRSVSRIYASLKPAYIWVDDDLRYDNHKPATLDSHIGCWCDECIAEFNERHSGRWTRQTLASALEKDRELDSLWHSWCVETLCDIAAAISEEVHKVSPQTKMAFQGKKEDFVVHHVKEILSVMHEKTGLPVGYRPGTGPRFDIDSPSGQIVKSMQSARFIELIGNPSFVDIWCPEIETWPRVYGSRTAQGVLVEAFTSLAYGLNSVSMFIMAADMEPAQLYSRSLLKPISEGSQVLMKYGRANEGTSVAGYKTSASCDLLYEFARTGVPVLPGVGTSLGEVQEAQIREVNIPKQLSSDIQKLRDRFDAPAVCCSPFVGLIIPRVSADGHLKTVGVVNTRIDTQEKIRIRLSGLSSKAKVIWHELKKKPVRCRVEVVDDQTYVEIPQIAAWNAGFLEIRNKK